MNVFIYAFEGKFSGNAEYEFNEPELGSSHQCILFLAQESENSNLEAAQKEILKFGLEEVHITKSNRLDTEALNSDEGKKFMPYVEEALEAGSSLVWYSNT